jgi:diaminopimelate epimerase
MCGNGIRCVAKYAYDHGLTGDTSIPIDTDDGVKVAECALEGGKVSRVRIDMGRPRFDPESIPVSLDGEEVVNAPIEINGRTLHMTCVSMGNPHAVVFVDDLSAIDVAADGRAMERHALFPDRTNAHFVRVVSRDRVEVLTWERGSGRTMACGTGVSAVCVAGAKTDRTARHIIAKAEGGELELEWADDDHVYKTGPAVEVFSGVWTV